jgi:hypothetical protein
MIVVVVTIELQRSSKTARVRVLKKFWFFLLKEKEKLSKSSTRIHPVPSTSEKF